MNCHLFYNSFTRWTDIQQSLFFSENLNRTRSVQYFLNLSKFLLAIILVPIVWKLTHLFRFNTNFTEAKLITRWSGMVDYTHTNTLVTVSLLWKLNLVTFVLSFWKTVYYARTAILSIHCLFLEKVTAFGTRWSLQIWDFICLFGFFCKQTLIVLLAVSFLYLN